jgi:hypothetical protein
MNKNLIELNNINGQSGQHITEVSVLQSVFKNIVTKMFLFAKLAQLQRWSGGFPAGSECVKTMAEIAFYFKLPYDTIVNCFYAVAG